MMDIKTIRIANARMAIKRVGGVGKAAQKMGYTSPSFLVQMFGPNPTRPVTEKTMRRMEVAFELERDSLDKPPADYRPPAPARSDGTATSQIDVSQLSRAIALVNKLIAEECVQLSVDRVASLVSIAYQESAEHAGYPSESKLRQVVRLFK